MKIDDKTEMNMDAVCKLAGSLSYSATYVGQAYHLTIPEIVLALAIAAEDNISFIQEVEVISKEEMEKIVIKAKEMAEERLQRDRESGLVEKAREEFRLINQTSTRVEN